MRRANAIPVIVVILIAVPLSAAETGWLVTDRGLAQEGEPVWLSFVVGETFPYGSVAVQPGDITSFVCYHGGKLEPVVGMAVRDQRLERREPIRGAGAHVFGCTMLPRTLDLARSAFQAHLESEGAAHRIQADAGPQPDGRDAVTERLVSFSKTIVCVGDAGAARGYNAAIGQRLEIVPLTNPCDWRVGTAARVQVLLDGYPWPDVALSVGHEGAETPKPVLQGRTDEHGIGVIEPPHGGHSFVRAYLIRPATGMGRHDYESFVSTLTYHAIGMTNVEGALKAAARAIQVRDETAAPRGLGPAEVIGFRMGKQALGMLGIEAGDAHLRAVHRTPLDVRFAVVADGVQAATGVSAGRLNLRVEAAPLSAMETRFENTKTGEEIVFRLNDDMIPLLYDATGEHAEAMSKRVSTMEDIDLFDVTPVREDDGAVEGGARRDLSGVQAKASRVHWSLR